MTNTKNTTATNTNTITVDDIHLDIPANAGKGVLKGRPLTGRERRPKVWG